MILLFTPKLFTMDTKLKNLFGIVGVITLLLFVGVLNKYVNAYSSSTQPASYRSFSTNGEGKVVAVPDVAQFSFGVTTEGGVNITALQQENTKKMNGAIAFLKDKKIDPKDIKTEQYNLQPRMQYNGCQNGGVCPPPSIVGYTISQTVSVKIRNFESIGDVMSGIATKGVNSVSAHSGKRRGLPPTKESPRSGTCGLRPVVAHPRSQSATQALSW